MDFAQLIKVAINAINLAASFVSLSSALKDNPSYDKLLRGEKSSLGKEFKRYISEHKEENIEIVIRGKRTLYKKIEDVQTEE